jgi:hypothetical protein
VRRTIGFLTLIALGLACGAAFGAAGSPVSIDARPHVVSYKHAVAIRGHAGRRSGVVVALEQEQFPFKSGFSIVSRQRTRRHGAYDFHQRPSQAVRYRVERARASSPASRTVRVYAEPWFSRTRCNLCGASSGNGGRRTLRVSLRLVYPKRGFSLEARKRVFLYYGQQSGSADPPRHLHLAETARQQRAPHHRTTVAIKHRVRLPHTYRFAIAVCTRSSMRIDGLGLPGPPGSHGCGDPRISYRESRSWLG